MATARTIRRRMPLRPGRLAAGIIVALLAASAVANASAAQAATGFNRTSPARRT